MILWLKYLVARLRGQTCFCGASNATHYVCGVDKARTGGHSNYYAVWRVDPDGKTELLYGGSFADMPGNIKPPGFESIGGPESTNDPLEAISDKPMFSKWEPQKGLVWRGE